MRAPAKLRCLSGLAALRRDHLLAQMMTKTKPLPPLEELQQLLDYDPETGVFRWKVFRSNIRAGTIAGYSHGDGYICIEINHQKWFAHRLAWLFITKSDPGKLYIDHVNGIKSDNRALNLRLATKNQNGCNVGLDKANTSGFKGVCWHKVTGKWQASIRFGPRQYYLGLFPTPELAHMAYCKAAAELHGEFARAA